MKKCIALFILILLFTGCTPEDEHVINMLDLTTMSKSEVDEFAERNSLKLTYNEVYSNLKEGTIINQSIVKGKIIHENDPLTVDISLGRLSDEDFVKNNVDELGRVPVMMYHGIHNKKNSETNYTGGNVDKDGYQRTAEAFASDLEFYYNSGYRMIRLTDYINGKIDVELGYSPIILTFDDGLENNIKVTGLDEAGNIIIDPYSAVGVMETFKKNHPGVNVTATFFINGGIFNQDEYNDKILNWLVDNGYDIGNHTWTHVNFSNASIESSQKEVGSIYELLEQKIEGKYVNIVALPFGSPLVKSHKTFPYILNGNYNGVDYHTESTLRVGWEADYSPFSKSFDKEFIKRIRAYDNDGKDFDITYNFNVLKDTRYISDGNVDTIVIHKEDEAYIADNQNLKVITY